MKKRAIYSVFAMLIMAFAALSASAQEPVRWKASAKMTSATEGIVTLTGTIESGWHLYSTQLPDVGPQPTKLSYTAKGITWVGNAKMRPAPIKEMDPMFEAELSYWENNVSFTRHFTCDNPEQAEITVSVSYMCCNDSSCRPPKTESFTLKVEKE